MKKETINKIITFLAKHMYIILFSLAALLVFSFSWISIKEVERIIVTQNQDQLLFTARSEARYIEKYLHEKKDDLKSIADDQLVINDIQNRNSGERLAPFENIYKDMKDNIGSLYLIDAKGIVLRRLPYKRGIVNSNYSKKLGVSFVKKHRKTYVSGTFKSNSGRNVISVCVPVFNKSEFLGIMRSLIYTEQITSAIKKIKFVSKGYSQIIDYDGKTIYHPDVKQVGSNFMEFRRSKLPDFNWNSVENIHNKMRNGKEGTGIYYSIWWDKNNNKRIKKLVAYTPIRLDNNIWSMGIVLGYNEITSPIFFNSIRISIILLIIIALTILTILRFNEARKKRLHLEDRVETTEELEELNKKLQESEEKYRLIIENAGDAILVTDKNGKFIVMNNSAAAFWGGKPKDFVDKSIFDILSKDLAENSLEIIKKVIRTGKKHITETLVTVKGEQKWLISSTQPIRDIRGHVVSTLTISSDITDRKLSESMLKTRLIYEEALAYSSQALLSQKENPLNSCLTYLLNASNSGRAYIFENFTNNEKVLYTRQTHEATAQGIKSQLKNEDLQRFPYKGSFERWTNILSQGKSIMGLVKNFPPEERDFLKKQNIISILILPIFTNKKWCGFIGFDDLKNERQWNYDEVRLLRTASEMIGSYIEREKTEEALRRAQSIAEKASLTKSNFLANMSHEIRTPMSGVIGMTELLLKSELNNEQKEYATMINNSAGVLLKIINNILDISKIEQKKVKIEADVFDVKELIRETLRFFEVKTKKKKLELLHRINNEVPTFLKGDPIKLRQILTNILENSIKFTREGRIELRVQNKKVSPEKVTLFFEVEDTGIGIKKDKTKTIFESFSQIDDSSKKSYIGTGLGLSITKNLVEIMDGTINVKSTLGKGSTFGFYIKFGIANEKEILKIIKENKVSKKEKGTSVPSLKILVAEDNFINQKYIETILLHYKHEVTLVGNGQKVLDLLAKKMEFDCILMDERMPKMDGVEATKCIRDKEKVTKEHIPIIALTASALRGDKERLLESGMDYYISKPYKENDILKFLEKVYNRYLKDKRR